MFGQYALQPAAKGSPEYVPSTLQFAPSVSKKTWSGLIPSAINLEDSLSRWIEADFKIASAFAYTPTKTNIPLELLNKRAGGLALIGADVGLNLFSRERVEFGIVGGTFMSTRVSDVLKTGPDSTVYSSRNYSHVGFQVQFDIFDFGKFGETAIIKSLPILEHFQLGIFYGVGWTLMSVPNSDFAGRIRGRETSISLSWDLNGLKRS